MVQGESHVELWSYSKFQDLWQSVLAPWFVNCLKRPQASNVFVCPSTSSANFIKSQLLENDIPTLGIQFYTPGRLRNHLKDVYGMNESIALREDLHLLMRLVAREEPEMPLSGAIELQPDQLVQAYDVLSAGGWGVDVIEETAVKQLLQRFHSRLESSSFITATQVDQWLYEEKDPQLVFDNLWLWGFDWRHSSVLRLLQSAVANAGAVVVGLRSVSGTTDAELSWLRSWETAYGSAEPVPSYTEGLEEKPFTVLSEKLEFPELDIPLNIDLDPPKVFIAEDISREADLITVQVLSFLAQKTCSRLGIVVASEHTLLAREISARLEQHSIPHHNHLGYAPGAPLSIVLFKAWFAYQENPQLSHWLNFINTLRRAELIDRELFEKIQRQCIHAQRDVLVGDLLIILNYIKAKNLTKEETDFYQFWSVLPSYNNWSNFFDSSKKILERLGCVDGLAKVEERSLLVSKEVQEFLSRGAFLFWLKDVLVPAGKVSDEVGRKIFARIHLLSAAEAVRQEWSHLILAGMSQSSWPGERTELAVLSDDCIKDLNQSCLLESDFGEGHIYLKDNCQWMLTSGELQYAFRNCFNQLVAKPSEELVLTAALKEVRGGGGELPVSELLVQLYLIIYGEVLGEALLGKLQALSSELIKPVEGFFERRKGLDFQESNKIKEGYLRRRDPSQPFDEYSFSFSVPPDPKIQFSCKEWEDVLKNPGSAWFKHVLKLQKAFDPAKDITSMAEGLWVHDWISLSGPMQKRPTRDSWNELSGKKALALRHRVSEAFHSVSRKLPEWWLFAWGRSQGVVSGFIAAVDENISSSYLASEQAVPAAANNQKYFDFDLYGRIDLLGSSNVEFRAENSICIVDFKTGSVKSFNAKAILKGDGLQLALYGLAFSQLGYKDVSMVLLQKNNFTADVLKVDAVLEQVDFLKALELISDKGVLGDRGGLHSSYTFSGEYPLATLEVSERILEEKWKCSHPSLV